MSAENSNSPLISIIMPIFNAEKYLRESLDSILRQTYDDFELIIVNDGSIDGTQSIINEYAARDHRIVAIRQENTGQAIASNNGATRAKGKYIIRHDADDVSFNTKLEDYAETLKKYPEAIVITGSIEVIDEKGEFLYKEYVPTTNDDIKRSLHLRNPLPNGATLVKKSVFDEVGGYSNVFAEDCDLWVKLYPLGEFVGTGTFVYKWRTNSTGVTFSNLEKTIAAEKEYVARIWSIEPPKTLTREEVISHSKKLIALRPKDGVSYKLAFLHDLARVSVHLIKHRRVREGLWQLVVVATTGRSGLKTVFNRLRLAARIPKGKRNVTEN